MESAPLVDCAGRRRSPATLSGYHRAGRRGTKGFAIHRTRRRSRRSSRSCAPPAMSPRVEAPRGDRRAVARRAADQRSARAGRERSGPGEGRDPGPTREGRSAARGRDGPLGLGAARSLAQAACGPADRRAVLRAARPDSRTAVLRRPGSVRSCATPRSAAGVRRRLAPHQLRHAHAVEMSREGSRWWSSSGNSGMPTSGSRPCTCAASTTPRSCTPSTNGPGR